ncbi:hypothetical protein ABEB36_001625 [Hypothenemus hampei]|uniref:Caspase-3 n=1 Tax=Hypothenemus hampei TaxID=57062 RepID=A0ABD1FF62_HYPHA
MASSNSVVEDAKYFEPSSFTSDSAPLVVPNSTVVHKDSMTGKVRFVERTHLNLEDLEYNRDRPDPGRIIIFNQEYFDTNSQRMGSRRDVNEIIMCFQRLGFNIDEKDVQSDLTVKGITDKIDSVLNDKKSLNETNSLIIFVMTHGGTNEKLHAKDEVFKCSDIWKKFNKCEELKGKPKMIVFQACKGQNYSKTEGSDTITDVVDFDAFKINQLGPDMLIFYSTLENNYSYRNEYSGTWFIQELCKNFLSYGKRDDVLSIVTRIIKCVCGNYYHHDKNESEDFQKQMPVFVSTLTKKFFLNRNKDRHLLLETNKHMADFSHQLEELLRTIKKNKLPQKKINEFFEHYF